MHGQDREHAAEVGKDDEQHGAFSSRSGVRGRIRRRRVEGEREAVHAVAQAGRLRAVVEHVAEMAAAAAAVHFGADHPERCVGVRGDRVVERFPSSASPYGCRTWWPTRTARGAAGARERALPVLVVQRAGVRTLGAGFAQDRVLGGREPAMPFGVAEGDFKRGGRLRGGRRCGERTADQRGGRRTTASRARRGRWRRRTADVCGWA